MPTKKTGNPMGRPLGATGKKYDRAGKIFEASAKMNRMNGFIYNVSVVYDSGAKFYLGVVDTPTPEAIGGKFGSGNFELTKMKRTTLEVMGEPIAMGVHPGVFELRYPDPAMAMRRGNAYPGAPSPFGFLPAGAPAPVAAHPGSSAEEIERRMKEELAKERERHEDELDALRAEAEDERDRKEQEKARDEERRSREAFELRMVAMLDGKKSGGDDITRTIELVKALMPPVQVAPPPAPRTDWVAVATAGVSVLTGLLQFGKQVAQTRTEHPVDTADLALRELLGAFRPLAERFLTPAPAPAPAPAGGDGGHVQAESMTEEQMMQAAFTQLMARLRQALDGKEAPEAVATWYWEQRGLGWMQVHGYTRGLEPLQIVQAINSYAPGIVKGQDEMAHLEFIAEAIKKQAVGV